MASHGRIKLYRQGHIWATAPDDTWEQESPVEVVEASALDQAERERDEAVARAESPYCVCGKEHRDSKMAGAGPDAPVEQAGAPFGPDCRWLTWEEVTERKGRAAGARRKEAKDALVRADQAEAKARELEGQVARVREWAQDQEHVIAAPVLDLLSPDQDEGHGVTKRVAPDSIETWDKTEPIPPTSLKQSDGPQDADAAQPASGTQPSAPPPSSTGAGSEPASTAATRSESETENRSAADPVPDGTGSGEVGGEARLRRLREAAGKPLPSLDWEALEREHLPDPVTKPNQSARADECPICGSKVRADTDPDAVAGEGFFNRCADPWHSTKPNQGGEE